MRIVQIPNGQFVENCYFVIDEATAECAIIDPGEEAGLIAHKLAAERVHPVAIWLTHAHIDHVLGVPRSRPRPGPGVSPSGGPRAVRSRPGAGLRLRHARRAPARARPGPVPRRGAAGWRIRVPGASRPRPFPRQCRVRRGRRGVRGDVLFQGSIGRTDLPGGDFDTLLKSIERELLTLPDSTIVYSGHGPETTVGRERRANPFLTGAHRLG